MFLFFCSFPLNHLCWPGPSCSNNTSSSDRAFHNSNIHLSPCSCPCHCSCLVVLAVLASLCLCPCLCRTHQFPLGHLLLDVTGLPTLCFEHVHDDLCTRSMFRLLLSRRHTTSVSHDSTAHASRDFPATGLSKNSCECRPQECVGFLWASRPPRLRLTRRETFHLFGGTHQLR